MAERSRGVCFDYSSPRGCRRRQCKFAHIKTPQGSDHSTIPRPNTQQARSAGAHNTAHNEEDLDNNERRRLQHWKAQIPGQQNAPPLQHRLAAWVHSGYDLVKSNHSDARQQVLQGLHSDGGLLRIRELLELAPADDQISRDGAQYLSSLAGPLLHTISYHEVVNSAFLEHAVDGIHIFMYGTGGLRALPFFISLSGIFAATESFSSVTFDNLLATVTVLQRIVDVNGAAKVNEDLQRVVNGLEDLLQRPDLVDHIQITPTETILCRIKQRMGIGLAIPEAENRNETTARISQAVRATFDVGRDMPGTLSPAGPRHDNDHHDIQQIQILPTENEVASIERPEYLPMRDPRSLHLPGVQGLFDRHFRLVREDNVGQLRDAVRLELQKLRHLHSSTSSGLLPDHPWNKGARTSTYQDLRIEKLHFDQDGICAEMSFAQPDFLAKRTPKEREQFYENTKRLRHDSLLCLVDATGFVTFFSVSEPRGQRQNAAPQRTPARLWEDLRGKVMIRLTQPYEFDIRRLLACFADRDATPQILVEFPGVLLAAFYHTLAALQRMNVHADLPFAEMIAPHNAVESTEPIRPQPPQYALAPGFAFDLSSLINDADHLELRPNQRFDFAKLQAHSTLDDAQQRAVIDALTRRLGLIQGPPGTGKSFTGVFLVKALLANAKKAKLGPIICVCYTNHALDQVLEHLVEERVTQIIRIGGQSKSEILKPINLREVSFGMDTTATERRRKRTLQQSLDDSSKLVRLALENLQEPGSWDCVKEHLDCQQHFHSVELQSLAQAQIDNEGFRAVSYDKRSPLQQWLEPSSHAAQSVPQGYAPRSIDQLMSTSIFAMTIDERFMLFQVWQREITERLTEHLDALLKECSASRDGLQKCRQEKDLRCLRGANIIGITTTGLARNLDLLRHLPSKVLLCEEAGEVLEAHLLTAMLPRIEHCILIGDHEQLRPQIANYELQSTNRQGQQYSLDTSLFERLIHPPYPWMPKLSYSTLEVQRRMHPSISELIQKTLYPRLKNHSSVLEYPQVKGISKRLYWLDHNMAEASKPKEGTSSHSNDYEVELTAALLTHLVRQGEYQLGDIAVLTPYLGQFVKLKRRLAAQFEITVDEKDANELRKQGVEEDVGSLSTAQRTTLLKALRLATVDNFQGEEAKVVVVSLVRSNPENRCGFLSTSNRINVLLSRARHGMYLIGDSTCYQSVPMWENVLQILRQNDNIGNALTLRCPRHIDTLMKVASPDDFLRQSPEGGCNVKCAQRLDCGHSCPNKCHAQMLHDVVSCPEPCPRPHKSCSHRCPKLCGEECGNCVVPIPDVLLPCGHTSTEMCFITQDTSLARCQTQVARVVPGCGHHVQLKCHISVDELSRCPALCDALLPCGHHCKRLCYQCNSREGSKISRTDHGTCKVQCGNTYNTCEHHCTEPCHRSKYPCKACTKPCNVFCNHSRCSKTCREPCAPCAETCNAGCEHTGFCPLPCSVPCDLIPCSERCGNTLNCGHRCPSVCGEQCPSEEYCQQCCAPEIKQKTVDYTEFAQYGDMNLDQDPCYVLACGHILSIDSLDGVMEMEQHYEVATNHQILSIKGGSQPFSVEQKFCPECRHPLRNLQRYNRIWRRGQLDEATKKFIAWSTASFVPLSKSLDILETSLSENATLSTTGDNQQPEEDDDEGAVLDLELSGTRDELIGVVLGIKDLRKRYKKAGKLRKEIQKFLKQVTEDEQPFGRVYNMVQSIRQNQQGLSVGMVRDDSALQTRQRLLATSLNLRCDLVIIADFLQLRKDSSASFAGKYDWRTVKVNLQLERARHDCLALATEGQERTLPATEVEALVFCARFAALEWSIADEIKQIQLTAVRDEALTHLTRARKLCESSPSTAGLLQEVDQAEKSLKDSTFYATVTNEERRQIVAAMATEFHVNGHWYRCPNGHPFTIANCGQAMQESNCPECGARVGGAHHQLADGNTVATDIVEEFGRMGL